MSHGIIYPSLLQSDCRRDTFRSQAHAHVLMMIAADGKQGVAESVHHAKASSVPDSRQKKLEVGSPVHAEREQKKAGADMCKREEQTGQDQAACMHPEKTGTQHPEDMRGTGYAVFHSARLAGADARLGIEGPIQPNARGQERQDAQIIFQESGRGLATSQKSTDSSQAPGSST